ncbi:hypothetical protein HDU81_010102 [Chytriomyces hyalinus]|nr:hypothetical protein HDU81_010102 [Chytriomyces hyalinus]
MLLFDQNSAYTQNNANLDLSQDNHAPEHIAHFQSSGSSIDALIFGGLSSPSVQPTDGASEAGTNAQSKAAPPISIPLHANSTNETSNTVSSNIPIVANSKPPSKEKLLAPESDQQQQIPNKQPPVRQPDSNVVASVPIQPAPFLDSAASSASQLPRFHETLMKKNTTATMNPIRALIVSHIGAKQFNQAAAALKQQQQQQQQQPSSSTSTSTSSTSRWAKSSDPKRRIPPRPDLFQRVKRASPNTKKRKEGTGKEAVSTTTTDAAVLFGGLEDNPSSQFASQGSAPGKKSRRSYGRKELGNTPPITDSSSGHFTGTSNLNQFFGSGLSSSSISNVGHESSSAMRMISVDEILEQAGVLGLGTSSGLVTSPSTMNARLIADLNARSMDAGNTATETQVNGLNVGTAFPRAESKSGGAAPASASVDEDNGLSDILQQLIRGILSSDGGQTDYGAAVGDGQHQGDSQDDVMQAVSALSMLLPDDLTKALTCSLSADTENDAVTASIEAAAKALISTLLENGDSTEDFLNKSLSPNGPLFQQQDPQSTQNPQTFQFNTTPSAASASSSTSSSFPSPMTTGHQSHQQQHHSISAYHNPHQRPPRQQHGQSNPPLNVPKSTPSGLYPNAAADFLYELDHVAPDGTTSTNLKASSSTLRRPSQLANQRKGGDERTSFLQSHEQRRLAGDPLQHLAGIGTSLLDFSLLSANGEGGGSNSSGTGGRRTRRGDGGEDRADQGWVSQESAERQNPSCGGATGVGCSDELILEELDRMFDDSIFDV